jgi:hypothetical protein
MAAIYSNGGNRWNILGFNLLKEMRYLVYIRYLWFLAVNNTRGEIWERGNGEN